LTKIPRTFLIILVLIIILIPLTLFPIFLTLDSWAYLPPFYTEGNSIERYAAPVTDVDFSRNADYIVTAGKTITFFAKESPFPLWVYSRDTDDSYVVVGISYDGKSIAAGSWHGYIIVFEEKSPNPLWKYSTGSHINSIDISNNGELIAVATDQQGLIIFNKTNSIPLWNYPIEQKFVEIALNGSYIVAGSTNDLLLFSSSSSIPLWNYTFLNEINCIATSQNGDNFLVGCEDGNIYYFNYLNPIPTWSYLAVDSVSDVSISNNGLYFVACDNSNTLYLFENSSSFPVWTYQLYNDGSLKKLQASISGDGNYMVLNKNGYTRLFHRSSSIPILKIDPFKAGWYYGEGNPIISYNGDYFATISNNGDLYFFNRLNTRLLIEFEQYYTWLFLIGYPVFVIINILIIYRNQKKKKRRRIVETLIKSSSKIKLEMIMDILDMNEKVFHQEFVKWNPDFGLKIEDDYLIIDKDKIPEIIDGLLRKFKEWEKLDYFKKK